MQKMVAELVAEKKLRKYAEERCQRAEIEKRLALAEITGLKVST